MITPEMRRKCTELWLDEVPIKDIAKQLNVHYDTALKAISAYKLPKSEHDRLDRENARCILARTIASEIPVFGKKRY